VGRGFWPGLCVSIKHNSKFASFTILTKGDYPAELNIPIPFSLISIDQSKDQLIVMPGYWLMYNMYALVRNSWKYIDRDNRTEKIQLIEYDYLAPDTINEMFAALTLIEAYTGKAYHKKHAPAKAYSKEEDIQQGKKLLMNDNALVDELEIVADNFENLKRKTVLIKVRKSYRLFKEFIQYYGTTQFMQCINENKLHALDEIKAAVPSKLNREKWLNIGGQLMPETSVDLLREKVRSNKIRSWEGVHELYAEEGSKYPQQKLKHALASLQEITGKNLKKIDASMITELVDQALATRSFITASIYQSREKDYTNPYRKMVYDSETEMNNVVGELENNAFIKLQKKELTLFKKQVAQIKKKLG